MPEMLPLVDEIRYRSGVNYAEEILEFLLHRFRVQEPITRSLDASIDDVRAFFTDLRDGGIQHSVAAFRQPTGSTDPSAEELIGVCLNHLDPTPPPPAAASRDTDEDSSGYGDFDPFKDYANEVESGPYKERNANRLHSFVCALEGDIFATLGHPSSIFHVDVICVAASCSRQGIGKELLRQSLEHADRLGCQLVSTAATAQASQEMFRRAGFYTVRELPFSCFRERRMPIFRNLPDGGRSGLLMAYAIREKEEGDEDLK